MKDPFLRSRKLSSGMPHAPLPTFIYGGAPLECMWVYYEWHEQSSI